MSKHNTPFMVPEILDSSLWVWYTDEHGGTEYTPAKYYEKEKQHTDITEFIGFGARLSAPGYLDATEWVAFSTYRAAYNYLVNMDDETGDIVYYLKQNYPSPALYEKQEKQKAKDLLAALGGN